MLQGSRLLPCPLCVPEAQAALGCHPRPSCHPAQALLCTLLPEGLSFQGAPWLLLVLSGLVPQEAPGFGGRHPNLQVAPVRLCHLQAQGALVYPEGQVHPSLQVTLEVHVAPVAPGTPLVLSGHCSHHILGGLWVLEGLAGLWDLEGLADHSLLDPRAEGQCSQGALEARGVLLGHWGQEVLDLQADRGQANNP